MRAQYGKKYPEERISFTVESDIQLSKHLQVKVSLEAQCMSVNSSVISAVLFFYTSNHSPKQFPYDLGSQVTVFISLASFIQ